MLWRLGIFAIAGVSFGLLVAPTAHLARDCPLGPGDVCLRELTAFDVALAAREGQKRSVAAAIEEQRKSLQDLRATLFAHRALAQASMDALRGECPHLPQASINLLLQHMHEHD